MDLYRNVAYIFTLSKIWFKTYIEPACGNFEKGQLFHKELRGQAEGFQNILNN